MQKTLFDEFDRARRVPVARARRTDPETSHIAAETYESKGNAASDRESILRVIRTVTKRDASGNTLHGLTAGEIADYLGDGWDNVRVSRRTSELNRSGDIIRGPGRECTIKHTSMSTWHPS